MMKIGVLADCFGIGWREGMQKAHDLGLQGVQLDAVEGEITPDSMTDERICEVREHAANLGLTISAVCGDLSDGGFAFAERNPWKIWQTKRIIDLALKLGCNVVTTHIGVVPADADHPRRAVMAAALEELGKYAESVGARLACETGPETAAVLRPFLDSLNTKGIGVNLDPANLAMFNKTDFGETVELLAPYIFHTHAKDGRLLAHCDTEIVYGMVDAPEDFDAEQYFCEVPLGEGDVRWNEYLGALKRIGYDGFLTIERECGDDPAGDIAMAGRFLTNRMKML